jgi:hypothetical protein
MLIHDKTDMFLYDEALLASRNTTSQYIQRVYTLQYIHEAKTKFSNDVIKKRQLCIYILRSQEL